MAPRVKCHSCRSHRLETFYEVKETPVHSCLMVSTREEALAFPRGNLALVFCTDCGFIQNEAFDASVHNYSPDYEETQAFSPRFRRFSSELCARQIDKYDLHRKKILEIGCGKGEFLAEICEMGRNRGIGLDPSYRPERTPNEAAARIEIIQDFYSQSYAHLRADYVACRHTLEHIQPVREFVRMLRSSFDEGSEPIVFFEVPDVERVLVEQAFWDIYYEHCTYFTLGSLARLFRSSGFEILDLYKGFDDQYLMIEARPGSADAGRRFDAEDDLERTAQNVKRFQAKVSEKLAALLRDLEVIKRRGQRAVVWGSGSKAVSYLTTLGITDELEYVVDINPHKHGKFLAGTGHEIVAPDFLVEYQPDVVIVMNPVYCEEIRASLKVMGLTPAMTAV